MSETQTTAPASPDPLASSRERDAQLAELKAEAVLVAATAVETTGTPREVEPGDRAVLERIVALGGHLMPLKPGIKKALLAKWQLAPAMSVDEALAHLAAGGNVGVHLGFSGLIALDAENAAATQRVLDSEFQLTVAPAKSRIEGNPKHHGSHTWLRVPEGIDPTTLHTKLQVNLPGGGVMDVLAGGRYAVAPPSTLDEAPGWAYSAYAGSPLDLAVPLEEAVIATAPLWLFDPTIDCPAGLEPLRGVLAPRTRRDLSELDARSIELTAAIDEVPWPEWLQADPRLTPAGEVDGCGCPIWHWAGADHSKSATLHEDCVQGSGAHIWSGTMQSQLDLGEHVSRLDLACALRGESRSRVAASVGIRLGGEQELTPVLAEDLETDAAEADARGDGSVAERLRARAAVMRSRQHEVAPKEGAVLIGTDSVVGAPAVSEPTSKKAPVIPIFSKKSPAPEGLAPAPALGSISAVSTPSTAGANALAPAPSTGASPLAGLRSGAWLDGQVFAPLEYHVPGLITEGCGIIAGPPKVGKSWFVLGIALAIAAGNSALGCIDCVARPVLYLALEDGWRRLRARSRQLLGDGTSIPAGIEFMLDVPEGATAVSVINEWLALYPGQKPFVIVDTLGKTRGAGPKSGASAYQEDYKAVGDLKRCVDAVPGSGMLIVHHTRKAEVGKGGRSADFVEELSGTFGLSGAADYAMVLHRDRETEGGILAITGRDVIERTLAMTRDADTGLWTLDGGSVEASAAIIEANRAKLDESRLGGTSQEIIEAITTCCPNPGDTVGPKEIADAIGATPVGIAKYLTRLFDGGYISRPERGRYAPVAAAPGTAPAS